MLCRSSVNHRPRFMAHGRRETLEITEFGFRSYFCFSLFLFYARLGVLLLSSTPPGKSQQPIRENLHPRCVSSSLRHSFSSSFLPFLLRFANKRTGRNGLCEFFGRTPFERDSPLVIVDFDANAGVQSVAKPGMARVYRYDYNLSSLSWAVGRAAVGIPFLSANWMQHSGCLVAAKNWCLQTKIIF